MNNHCSLAALALGLVGTVSPALADDGFYMGFEGGQGRTQLTRHTANSVLTPSILIDASSDRDDTALGVYGGYKFAKHFGVELSYADLGEASFATVQDVVPLFIIPGGVSFNPVIRLPPPLATAPVAGAAIGAIGSVRENQRMTFEGEALSLSLIGSYPLADSISVFGRAGIAAHRYKVTLEASLAGQPVRVVGGPGDQSVGAAVFGVGVEWSIHSNWALRLQGQRHFAIGDESINLVERGDVTSMTAGVSFMF